MKPKIVKVFEKNINTKLVLVYVTIALLCVGFFALTNSLFADLKKHKERYRYSSQILLETNNLVSQFYNIQEYGNLFLIQKELHYFNMYQKEIDVFQQKLEQVALFIQHEDMNLYLANISSLLHEKKMMLQKLQQLFNNKRETDSIYQKIAVRMEKKMENAMPETEINEAKRSDTLWQKQLTFGQRLKEAFISNKKRGKNVAAINTLVTIDTITRTTFTAYTLLDSLQDLTHYYQNQHALKIGKIEIEFLALLNADQYITKEITSLLLRLHEELLLNVISLGEDFEAKSKEVMKKSVMAGTFALLLISALIILIIRNVKTIRKIYEALAIEKQKTEELMESRHRLLLAISHDIKTPLNALLGYLELWENENLSHKQLHELNSMQYSGKYILSLLNNLLEFSRLEQNKTQITKENIEIVPFVMEIMEMFQPLCHEKNNKLTYDINVKENPQILMDSLKLKQILVNLISNAVKYTNKGEINVRVEEVFEPARQVRIKVSDTGKGFPKEKLSSIFQPFTRIEKNSSGIEGTGLGLFVVKGLVDILGGTIDIETEENRGTTVTFSLPFENVLEHAKPDIHPGKSLIVWIIEDDATQLQVINAMLNKLGHKAVISNSKEAFENELLLNPFNYDVVFTDLEMGDLNGYEVLQKVKSHFDVPVICLSGTNATSKTELQQMGFDDFLEKPVSMHQLKKILTSIQKQKTEMPTRLFSLDTLNEMFGNDKETVFELLKTFSKSLPDDIQSFEHAMAEENLILVQQTAHRLLPFCKQINATGVVPILEKIELSKKENKFCFNDLKEDVALLILKLKKLLSEILFYKHEDTKI